MSKAAVNSNMYPIIEAVTWEKRLTDAIQKQRTSNPDKEYDGTTGMKEDDFSVDDIVKFYDNPLMGETSEVDADFRGDGKVVGHIGTVMRKEKSNRPDGELVLALKSKTQDEDGVDSFPYSFAEKALLLYRPSGGRSTKRRRRKSRKKSRKRKRKRTKKKRRKRRKRTKKKRRRRR